ncbi:alpha/beta fold hydrolase [Streptomyces sp. RS10V-4]|uniref:thioesterase II family protein n=1 Tax=Streptomyces rhizoryzae TaxID=2932493 RepID=UPI0020065DE1|nr:alpha/beta fold hydrolase [Streptomyces rhizoryzae]MCK7624461.1 alpha/beta fold hydrolase [Streptomyces rhizoryzae]
MTAVTGPWIRRFHTAPRAAVRLVCFPHAGGSASAYLSLSRELAPEREVLAIQYPGRQDRRTEPCIEDLVDLAAAITPELKPWADAPMALFGHSMGATVAFEVARRLTAGGHAPVALFASARRAPSRSRDESTHLHDERLLAEVRQLDSTTAEVLADEDLRAMVLPALRADYKAAETYRYVPGAPLTCPLIALTGTDDTRVSREEAESWAEHTTADFALHAFPGGHFFFREHLADVVALINGRLAASPAAAEPGRSCWSR